MTTHRLERGDCLDVLERMPADSVHEGASSPYGRLATMAASDLTVGIAAEHLVCAELLLDGFSAYRTDQHCAYDVAVDFDGRIVKVQVKATRGPRNVPQRATQSDAYIWHTRRSGKRGGRTYAADAFDVLALVALDVRRVAYMPPTYRANTVIIRALGDPVLPGRPGKRFDDFPFRAALEALAA